MSFPDETLYARNDDDMEDYGDISAYDDSMEEEYEEEEEEEMGEPAELPRGGEMTSVPSAISSSGSRPPAPVRKAPAKKKAAKKKGGRKKAGKAARRGPKKPAKKKAGKKKGGRKRR